jgi:hypothetical protein
MLTDLIIPASVTRIGKWAFAINKLTSITIQGPIFYYADSFGVDFFASHSFFFKSQKGTYLRDSDGKWTLNGVTPEYCVIRPGDSIYVATIDGEKVQVQRERLYVLAPGWHDIETGYSKATESMTTYSKGTVTFKQRYLFTGGHYSVTGKIEGDQILFSIKLDEK